MNTESAMEKESWIKQMQNPNPALFQQLDYSAWF